MQRTHTLPEDLEFVRARALQVIDPIKPASDATEAEKDFLFRAQRTDAGRSLPPYYLVYFLLVDLLKFKNLGRFEKVSWSVPIDFRGRAFLIDHRKFGVGVFARKCKEDEAAAKEIVSLMKRGVKTARPFFDYVARSAVIESKVNVFNNSSDLYDRHIFLSKSARQKLAEAEERKDERTVDMGKYDGCSWRSVALPSARLRFEANWLALSAIEAFFSWTEHVFIHLALLSGKIANAEQVASLAGAEWSAKFKTAMSVKDAETKKQFDELLRIRYEVRNYVAHGAFGKRGEAFEFHSGAGAVPVLLPHNKRSNQYSLGEGLELNAIHALEVIDSFVSFFWANERAPAQVYIQKSELPIIMTMVSDGTYAAAMQSADNMEQLVEHLSQEFDRAANMDW